MVVPAVSVSHGRTFEEDEQGYLPMNMFIDVAQVAITLPRTSRAAPSKET